MHQKDFSWTEREIRLLEGIHPSLERLLGQTPFPPDEDVLGRFIDTLSMYGFHCFPSKSWDSIDKSGLIQESSKPTYFIADRVISPKPLYVMEQTREIVSPSEYLSRFNNSVRLMDERVRIKYNSTDKVLVINRQKALILDGKNAKEDNEMRGAGFLGDALQMWRTLVLDEGILDISRKFIPREAIVGYFIPYQVRKQPIVDFYELVVPDFLKNSR